MDLGADREPVVEVWAREAARDLGVALDHEPVTLLEHGLQRGAQIVIGTPGRLIDLIDRNLYERTCDVRWWATDSAMVAAAAEKGYATGAFASVAHWFRLHPVDPRF